ncbi:gluconate 2-dehydrogenase subunit 3 family protein [Gilvibacter sp.]|uniref:gluconate 2-dehydrogenase subunit 3 family protein n=1 Tax=Gilvibacter sp. TaxID=2729997 RepID=UPI003F4A5D96
MDRRQALKNIGLTTGFVVASPALFSLLESCTSSDPKWVPAFMDETQAMVVGRLADVFLPKTEPTPAASELNVVQFIDTYWNDVSTVKYQGKIKTVFGEVIGKMKAEHGEDLSVMTDENYMAFLDANMLHPRDEKPDPPGTNQGFEDFEDDTPVSVSKFLNGLKWMCINAYLGTQQIGEDYLVYEPVPGTYVCDDLQTLTGGKRYSL